MASTYRWTLPPSDFTSPDLSNKFLPVPTPTFWYFTFYFASYAPWKRTATNRLWYLSRHENIPRLQWWWSKLELPEKRLRFFELLCSLLWGNNQAMSWLNYHIISTVLAKGMRLVLICMGWGAWRCFMEGILIFCFTLITSYHILMWFLHLAIQKIPPIDRRKLNMEGKLHCHNTN